MKALKQLAKHNEYRKKHGAPALSYSDDLCSSAQAWADHLLSANTLGHSDTEDGENVYYFQSSVPKKLTGKSRHKAYWVTLGKGPNIKY